MSSIEAEWIEWSGGNQPVNDGVEIEVVGESSLCNVKWTTYPEELEWEHNDGYLNITAYRIHNAFKDAPDKATHLLAYGQKIVFAALDYDMYFGVDKHGIDYVGDYYVGTDSDSWQVIATRKREERNVTYEEHKALQSALESSTKLVSAGRTADEQEPTPEPVTAHNTVQAALKHMQDRATTYDKPTGERSMSATVEAFNAIAGTEITEEQGWMFMALLKIVRSQQGEFKADNYEDLAAYAGLMAEAGAVARMVEQERNK